MRINPSVETMANFTEVLKNEPKKAYDFIANYGHLFDKNEFADGVVLKKGKKNFKKVIFA